MPHIRRALISVSDKRGLLEFASALCDLGVDIISTGGTLASLRAHGLKATPVSDVTGFPEILDGRVKTLHPAIHAGILAASDNPAHRAELEEHNIEAIDLVVVNLYPFEQTVARNGISLSGAIELIDVGGPAMLRAAAKNFQHKVVIVNPDRYPQILREMAATGGSVSDATCIALAREVFRHTSAYDAVIAGYLEQAGERDSKLPELLHLSFRKSRDLRYGENPHQRAALYGTFGSFFDTLHGKELSYNNIVDISAAARIVAAFEEITVAIVKHTNPCGVGSGPTVTTAYRNALATDPVSAFGGIVAFNKTVDVACARLLNELFLEVVVAPAFDEEALTLLQTRKDRRIIRFTDDFHSLDQPDLRSVPGGILVQDPDTKNTTRDSLSIVTKRTPDESEFLAMQFAWRVATFVKSNAIVYARPDRTIGIGAGQMSRLDSSRLAVQKAVTAGLDTRGTAVASDGFFPFADGLMEAVNAGATAVIQPGGSVRDNEVIQAADEHNVAMAFTGIRHFSH